MKPSDHPASTSAGVTSDHTAAEPRATSGTATSAHRLPPGTDSTPNIRDRAAGRVSTGAYSCSRWRSTGTMATAVQAASITTAARQPHAS